MTPYSDQRNDLTILVALKKPFVLVRRSFLLLLLLFFFFFLLTPATPVLFVGSRK